jgi:hypothetical protein
MFSLLPYRRAHRNAICRAHGGAYRGAHRNAICCAYSCPHRNAICRAHSCPHRNANCRAQHIGKFSTQNRLFTLILQALCYRFVYRCVIAAESYSNRFAVDKNSITIAFTILSQLLYT